MGDANVFEPLEHGFFRGEVKSLPKIYKAVVDFRRFMLCLLNDGLEGKYVNNGLMSGYESFLPPGSEVPTIKLTRELHMENRSVELRECMTHHVCPVIVGIQARA
jgi:hypothetical protein